MDRTTYQVLRFCELLWVELVVSTLEFEHFLRSGFEGFLRIPNLESAEANCTNG